MYVSLFFFFFSYSFEVSFLCVLIISFDLFTFDDLLYQAEIFNADPSDMVNFLDQIMGGRAPSSGFNNSNDNSSIRANAIINATPIPSLFTPPEHNTRAVNHSPSFYFSSIYDQASHFFSFSLFSFFFFFWFLPTILIIRWTICNILEIFWLSRVITPKVHLYTIM